MSATARSEDAPAAGEIADRLREADFVRLVGAATGDALAASGVLARALSDRDRPFQVSVADLPADTERSTDADLTVAVGRTDPVADCSVAGAAEPASETAFVVARELDTGPDVALALAGCVADGRAAAGAVAEAAEAAGLERRPGVAVPTADLIDGLAHSTLVRGPFSGDPEAAAAALDDAGFDVDGPADGSGLVVDATILDETARRRVASLVALRTVGDDSVPSRGGHAVERALRPFDGGPFETVGGYADVLDAVARERPGTGVALALGHDVAEAALDAWRAHARRAHDAVADATTGRYDGLFVARAETDAAPVATLARLVHAYRSPEPVTLAVTDGAAAARADDRALESVLSTAAEGVDGTAAATGTTGRARFDVETGAFITAFREAL
ncbi:hypothetical protein I7X12_02240 [Halosimplex litoreum]|uniref:Exonuclease RecJ n=1 Tax=Halosimplex litoreum TaxID=1198301 RepID=A0A7T3FZC0_9EURY|nr:hypothetical protein [Halosimplex litoreum]QPV63475.1 hypothetical protein I7X12_02240 [Halosimplex litoreum]